MINLWQHQEDAANKVGEVGSMGLWMGMRTGKTLTSLSIMERYNLYPSLIISPLSVTHTWADDYQKLHGTEDGFRIVSDRNQLTSMSNKVYCTNYEKVLKLDAIGARTSGRSHQPSLSKTLGIAPYKSIFIDESYRIANWNNKITQHLLLWDKPEDQYRFCLSGSPASEECYNMATQYLWMHGEFFGCTDIGSYLDKFWKWNEYTFKFEVRDYTHPFRVREFMQTFGYAVTMQQLGLGSFPVYNRHRFDLNEKQRQVLRNLKYMNIYPHKITGEDSIMYPMTRVLFERKVAAGMDPFTEEIINTEKMEHVIQMYKDSAEPMLVTSFFRIPLQYMYERALQCGYKAAIIHGDISDAERERIRVAFQAGEIDIVFAQPKTIYVGLNFSRAMKLVFYANDYSQDIRSQLEQRPNHTLRTIPWSIIDLLYRETVEEDIVECLVVKKKNADFYLQKMNELILMRTI